MDNLFQLEIGSWTNLKGHAVVYWDVLSEEEPFILGINFCISAFPFEGNLIATTFPVSRFYSREEFMFYIRRSSVDLISLGELDMSPYRSNDLSLLQHQQLNKVIEYYLRIFKTKLDDKTDNLTPKEIIDLVKTWLNHLQRHDKKNSRSDISSMKMQIKQLLLSLGGQNIPQKDIDHFLILLNSKKRKRYQIMSLYLQEYLAILAEEYEQVISLRKEIEQLNS